MVRPRGLLVNYARGMWRSGTRVQRLAASEEANRAFWPGIIERFDPARVITIKAEGGSAVYAAELGGARVIIKRRELRGLWERLKAVWRASRGHRHWRGAAWLTAHGFRTAKTFAMLVKRRGSELSEWLVMEILPGKSVLQHLADADLTPGEQHSLATTLGRQVARLGLLGRFNRDHKPSNLIVTRVDTHDAEVGIIDCVAIQRGRGSQGRYRMLASLLIEPMGCGVTPRATLVARCLDSECRAWLSGVLGRALDEHVPMERSALRQLKRTTARRVAALIRAHGDPTPAVDPLR